MKAKPGSSDISKKLVIHRPTLLLHAAIADKLIAQPALLELAEACLEQRYAQKLMRYGCYIVWQSLLPLVNTSPKLFKQELLSEDLKMEQLRRQTIFVGILTEQERQDVLAQANLNEHLED